MVLNWRTILSQCKYEPRLIPILLALLRIFICFLPQTGYLHPDEFFQSTDIIAGDYFHSKVQPAWEFKVDKPIRCMLLPSVLINLAFKIATLIQKQPNAYLLLVAPRLAYTLVSFTVDYCLYKLCQYYSSRGLWYLPVSVIFQSSFVCLGCMTRTFSNALEVIIYSVLLVVVAQTIKPKFIILFVTPSGRSTPVNERIKKSTQIKSSIFIGFLITLGTFNRPTFPCFAIVPLLYWALESIKRNSYKFDLTLKHVVIPLALSTSLTAVLISAFDTAYYTNVETLKTIFSRLLELKFKEFLREVGEKWIFTPYNFIVYNSSVNNLSRFGLHPPYTHMLLNIPLAFNVLGLMFYGKLTSLVIGSGVYRLVFSAQRIYALMLLSTLISTILLSFIPHQEFRFLLPLIVPLAYVFAFNIYTSNKLLPVWLLSNLLLTCFYATIHQSAVTRSCLDLDPILKSYRQQENNLVQINVIAYQCYLTPSYLWNIDKDDCKFNFDLMDTEEDLKMKLDRVLSKQRENPLYSHKLYLMLPHLYMRELIDSLQVNFSANSPWLVPIRNYTHFSGEDFKNSINHIKKFGLKEWRTAFGFSLIQVDLNDLSSLSSND